MRQLPSSLSHLSAACSIHSNWEVVVRDGALPGGGGMQDAPRQLWLDVLRWQQNQNHQGKITCPDRRRARGVVRGAAWHRQNSVSGGNLAVKAQTLTEMILFSFLSLEHAAIHHIGVLTLWERCDGTPPGQRLSCRSASSFLQTLGVTFLLLPLCF